MADNAELLDTKTALRAHVEPVSGLDILTLGNTLAKSGYFRDASEAAKAVVKVLYGRELGLGPITAMTGVHIVEGKPGLAATTMATLIKRSGLYNYRVKEHTHEACELVFFEKWDGRDGEWSEVGTSRFTLEDAERAGLKDRATWKTYPKNLLFARAMSNGAKWYCPLIFGGPVYSEDELEEIHERARAEGRTAVNPPVVVTPPGLGVAAMQRGQINGQDDAHGTPAAEVIAKTMPAAEDASEEPAGGGDAQGTAIARELSADIKRLEERLTLKMEFRDALRSRHAGQLDLAAMSVDGLGAYRDALAAIGREHGPGAKKK